MNCFKNAITVKILSFLSKTSPNPQTIVNNASCDIVCWSGKQKEVVSAVRSHWNIIYWASWDKSAQVRRQTRLLRNSAYVIPKERSQMFIIPCVSFLWDIKLVMCRCAPRLYFPHRSNMSIEYSFAQTSYTKEKDHIIAFQPISHWLAPNLFIKLDCKLVAMGLIDKLIKKIRRSVLFVLFT